MPDFRNLWRSERNGPAEPGMNGRKPADKERARPAAEGAERDDFRYQPEARRHRYPEGLYSGISRDEAAARHNGRDLARDPLRAGPRDSKRTSERAEFADGERARPDYPRAEFKRPDYERTERDREAEEEPAESWPRHGVPVEDTLPSGPHRGRGPRGYQRSDERIREDVCDRLTDDPEIDASDIEVAVAKGEVTLSGSVDSRLIRRLAEDLADAVSGVTLVQNNLKIGTRGPSLG